MFTWLALKASATETLVTILCRITVDRVETLRWQHGSPMPKNSQPKSTLGPMLRREEHNLRMDEIRQRMEQEQELFELRKEKLQLEIARERVQLEISQHQLSTLTSANTTLHEVVFSSSKDGNIS